MASLDMIQTIAPRVLRNCEPSIGGVHILQSHSISLAIDLDFDSMDAEI